MTFETWGETLGEGGAVRWTGFLATGGGAFLEEEEVVEVDGRRAIGGGGGVFLRDVFDMVFVRDVTEEDGCANGGGRTRVPFVGWRGFGGGGAASLVVCLGTGCRGIFTQSGSSVRVYGLEGRFGFGTKLCCGGCIFDLAG